MANEDLGPRVPLMADKVKYRLRSNSDAATVVVYVGPKKVGVLSTNWTSDRWADHCTADITKMREKYPQVGTNLLMVYGAEILEEHRGKHIGRSMYEAMMAEMFKQRGPFLFLPMRCGGSGTSADAMRVWQSLAKDYPTNGNVLAVVQRPTLPVEKLARTIVRRYLAALMTLTLVCF
jgi:hypothetical protein